MKLSNRFVSFSIAAAFLVLALIISASSVASQGAAWQFTRADYGFRTQRADVTKLLRELISHGGVNNRIAVNNQTMGGDPAPGANKVLRIFARDSRNEEHEFDYNEGTLLPANIFFVRIADRDERGGPDDHDRFHGAPDRDDRHDLAIVKGYYGAQGRMTDVTDVLQHMVHDGALTVNANNRAIGLDPAPGADKLLIVIYQYHGNEQAMAASEGHTLSIP
jgi:hypothetical protein